MPFCRILFFFNKTRFNYINFSYIILSDLLSRDSIDVRFGRFARFLSGITIIMHASSSVENYRLHMRAVVCTWRWYCVWIRVTRRNFADATGLIIPEELPTILSLIYSNIPPIKKGTDSRLGMGFRLGEHADFQILLELGPQTETNPIGTADSKRRRDVSILIFTRSSKAQLSPWLMLLKEEIERDREDQCRSGRGFSREYSNYFIQIFVATFDEY